jgi:hypothetical protein
LLSAHNLLIAAIFIPYTAMMVTLGTYIWHTSQPPVKRDEDDPPASGDAERAPDLPLAA